MKANIIKQTIKKVQGISLSSILSILHNGNCDFLNDKNTKLGLKKAGIYY